MSECEKIPAALPIGSNPSHMLGAPEIEMRREIVVGSRRAYTMHGSTECTRLLIKHIVEQLTPGIRHNSVHKAYLCRSCASVLHRSVQFRSRSVVDVSVQLYKAVAL